MLAGPLASPEDIEDLDGWPLHRLRYPAFTYDAEDGTATPIPATRRWALPLPLSRLIGRWKEGCPPQLGEPPKHAGLLKTEARVAVRPGRWFPARPHRVPRGRRISEPWSRCPQGSGRYSGTDRPSGQRELRRPPERTRPDRISSRRL